MQEVNVSRLPNPPGVAAKILELSSKSDVTLDELCTVVGVDSVLTARIVSYANSPKFARRYRAETLNQAIALLGVNGVKMIALSFSLIETKADDSGGTFSYEEFWKSSLATGICAKNVFNELGLDPDVGFLQGLLLNVGQLAFANSQNEEYQQLFTDKSVYDCNLVNLEQEIFGVSRYQIAIDVLKNWSFPENIIETYELCTAETDQKEVAAMKLASTMSYCILTEQPDFEVVNELPLNFRNILGKEKEEASEFYTEVNGEYSELAEILAYEVPPQTSLLDLELEAKNRMLELTMDLHQANNRVSEEITELKSIAFVDPLTELGNRRQYEKSAYGELELCKRHQRSFGLIVCDIDFFKKVNDVYGHAAGDAILKGVSDRLRTAVRAYDHIFRFGGEEFVAILPESDAAAIAVVAERIRLGIEAEKFVVDGTEIAVTISLGGAEYHPVKNNVSLDELFQQADEALYKAKEGGRNQFRIATEKPGLFPNMPTGQTQSDSVQQH